MFEMISSFFDQVTNFIEFVWYWFATGIYTIAKELLVAGTKIMIYSAIQMAIFSADIASEVVRDISADLHVTQYAQNAYNQIPQNYRNTLDFFGVPQALTIILTAIPTKIVMRFIPFVGR